MKAQRRVAVYGAVLLCLLLAGCADQETPPPQPAPAVAATAPPPAWPELSAPEPEAPHQVVHKSAVKVHLPHKTARRGRPPAVVAKAAPAQPAFRCHIVREADLEGAAAQPPETEPGKVDLYAKVDNQPPGLSVERAADPGFAQAGQHCGDGKPSLAAPKKKILKRQRHAKPRR